MHLLLLFPTPHGIACCVKLGGNAYLIVGPLFACLKADGCCTPTSGRYRALRDARSSSPPVTGYGSTEAISGAAAAIALE